MFGQYSRKENMKLGCWANQPQSMERPRVSSQISGTFVHKIIRMAETQEHFDDFNCRVWKGRRSTPGLLHLNGTKSTNIGFASSIYGWCDLRAKKILTLFDKSVLHHHCESFWKKNIVFSPIFSGVFWFRRLRVILKQSLNTVTGSHRDLSSGLADKKQCNLLNYANRNPSGAESPPFSSCNLTVCWPSGLVLWHVFRYKSATPYFVRKTPN